MYEMDQVVPLPNVPAVAVPLEEPDRQLNPFMADPRTRALCSNNKPLLLKEHVYSKIMIDSLSSIQL